MIVLSFVACCSLLQCEPLQSKEDIDGLILDLSSDNVKKRDASARALSDLSPDNISALRKHHESAAELEVKGRLDEIIRAILNRQAKELYERGELKQALLIFAEASGSKNPKEFVENKVREAMENIIPKLPRSYPPGSFRPYFDIGRELEKNAPWSMAAIFSMITLEESDDRHHHGRQILRTIKAKGVPVWCAALKSDSESAKLQACSTVTGVAGGGSPAVIEALKALYHNPAESPIVRSRSKRALVFYLGAAPDKKKE